MTENKNKESKAAENKKSATPVIAGVLLVLGVVVAGGLYASSEKSGSMTDANEASITPAAGEVAATESDSASNEALEAEDEQVQAAENAPETVAPAEETVATADDEAEDENVATAGSNDLAALSKPRILGNPDSPITISEHSSFTCGGCAHFHGDNFKKIKADYIDTGKAHIVFDDFPRNPADLEIGMVARCLPETAYFNFVQLIFETQAKWANEDYKKYIKQNAMLAGLNDEKYEECINNAGLQKALAENREAASNKFGITGTPTLVINGKQVISGLAPYNQIKDALDAAAK